MDNTEAAALQLRVEKLTEALAERVAQEAAWAVQVVNLKAGLQQRDEALASMRRILSAIAEHRRGDYDDRNAAGVAIKLIDATLLEKDIAISYDARAALTDTKTKEAPHGS